MEVTHFSAIPNEIVEQILKTEVVSFIDVCKFGSVSSRYWDLVSKGNQLWRTKFKQM